MSLGDRLALKNRLRNSYPSLTFLNPMAKYRFPCKVYLTSRQFGTATSLLMPRSARYRSRTLLYRGPKRTSVKLSFLRRSSLSFSSVRETVLCSGARPPHVSVMNLACALKSPLPINSSARLNMSPPCRCRSHARFPFVHSPGTRRCVPPVRGQIPVFVTPSSCRFISHPCQKSGDRDSFYLFYSHRCTVLMDNEFDSQSELGCKQIQGTSPQGTFPDIGKQDNAVCQVSLKFQGYRTAIDKRILGEQR